MILRVSLCPEQTQSWSQAAKRLLLKHPINTTIIQGKELKATSVQWQEGRGHHFPSPLEISQRNPREIKITEVDCITSQRAKPEDRETRHASQRIERNIRPDSQEKRKSNTVDRGRQKPWATKEGERQKTKRNQILGREPRRGRCKDRDKASQKTGPRPTTKVVSRKQSRRPKILEKLQARRSRKATAQESGPKMLSEPSQLLK
jgi:hypothetical protein